MCGIAAIVNQKKSVNHSIGRKMVGKLSHRGPDAQAYIEINQNIGLGHTHLRMTDLSTQGGQPFTYKHLTIVFNGEVYNASEIRYHLTDQTWNSTTDTEVLAKSFVEIGIEETIKKINGCFAIIVYNHRTQKISIIRDRIGEKQLFYTQANNGDWLFASEAKAFFAHTHVPKTCNEQKLLGDIIMGDYYDQRNTYFKDVYQCEPGHLYTLKNNHLVVESVYFNPWHITPQYVSRKELRYLIEQFSSSIQHAVHLQQQSPAPIGYLLSGGLDSSLITALGTHYAPKVSAYITRYHSQDNPDYNHAQLLASQLPIDLYATDPADHDVLSDTANIMYAAERPIDGYIDLALYYNYATAKEQGYKGMLNGQGSDECWMGYINSEQICRLPKQYYSSLELFSNYWIQSSPLYSLLKPQYQDEAQTYCRLHLKENWPKKEFTTDDLLTRFMITTHLRHLLHQEDKLAMYNGIEVRLPYLDSTLVQLSLLTSSSLKYYDGKEKYINRQAAKKYVPSEILHRKKLGYPYPQKKYYAEYMQSKKRSFERVQRWFNTESIHHVSEKNQFQLHIIEQFLETYDI